MEPAAQIAAPTEAWRISRDGMGVASVAVRQEKGEVVVDAELRGGRPLDAYRFPSLQSAEAFTRDLMMSFAYLGCDVARA
jgi:hypothetical protein